QVTSKWLHRVRKIACSLCSRADLCHTVDGVPRHQDISSVEGDHITAACHVVAADYHHAGGPSLRHVAADAMISNPNISTVEDDAKRHHSSCLAAHDSACGGQQLRHGVTLAI